MDYILYKEYKTGYYPGFFNSKTTIEFYKLIK